MVEGRFNRERDVIDREVRLNGQPFTTWRRRAGIHWNEPVDLRFLEPIAAYTTLRAASIERTSIEESVHRAHARAPV